MTTTQVNLNAIQLSTIAIGMAFEIKCPGMKFTGKANVWQLAKRGGVITPRRQYNAGEQRLQALSEVAGCLDYNGMRIPSTVMDILENADNYL